MARPRNFEENGVLDAARDAFWAHGYEGTSTRDLVQRTGLSQPSLYNAFGDKRALFLRALEHYLEHTLRERIARLESTLPPAQAISAFFGEVVERSIADTQQRGCMLVNAALEATPQDEAFRQAIAEELNLLRSFFLRCFTAGQQSGEIQSAVAPDAAATHLLAVQLGVRVLARIDPARALLTGAVAPALSMLGLPELPPETRRP
jgi:TetR/AcrR family transcriptional repressor of nem operon